MSMRHRAWLPISIRSWDAGMISQYIDIFYRIKIYSFFADHFGLAETILKHIHEDEKDAKTLFFWVSCPGGSVSTKMCMHARYQIHGERGSFQWMCMHV